MWQAILAMFRKPAPPPVAAPSVAPSPLASSQPAKQGAGKKTIIGVVGAAAAAILVVIVPQFEGVVNVGYRDPIGIPTKCMGDTTDVELGRHYTDAECRASLETQLIAHAEPILRCVPGLNGRTYQLAAAVSFAYNIGTSAFCNSTAARRFNAGDWRGGCKAFNESDSGAPQWVTAGGRVLPGLVTRRAAERKLCEQDLT